MWECLVEYYRQCSLGSRESQLLLDVAAKMWQVRAKPWTVDGWEKWKVSEHVHLVEFALVVAVKLDEFRREIVQSWDLVFSDCAFKKEAMSILHFYYKIHEIFQNGKDVRTLVYIVIMSSAREELVRRSDGCSFECGEVLRSSCGNINASRGEQLSIVILTIKKYAKKLFPYSKSIEKS